MLEGKRARRLVGMESRCDAHSQPLVHKLLQSVSGGRRNREILHVSLTVGGGGAPSERTRPRGNLLGGSWLCHVCGRLLSSL